MGHLLLSLAGHTAKGIMIGGWRLKELQQAAHGELLFTRYEAARMREEVKRRAAAAEGDRSLADAARMSACPYSFKSSRRRLVWTRLTGISVCFLSSIRNW